MRITSWNIQHGIAYKETSLQIPDMPANLAALDRGIDSSLYLFQEVDCRLERSGEVNQPLVLAEAVGAVDFRFAPGVIGAPGPHGKEPHHNERILLRDETDSFAGYGNLVISKVPVKKWLRKDLGKSPIPAPILIGMGEDQRLMIVGDELRVAIAAVLENGFTVINAHLSFVSGVNMKQLWSLIRWAHHLEKEYDTQVIIAGDLNLPGSIVRRMSRWSSPPKGATFPAWNPKIEFDHFLVKPRGDHTFDARCEDAQIFGDHLPITLTASSKAQ